MRMFNMLYEEQNYKLTESQLLHLLREKQYALKAGEYLSPSQNPIDKEYAETFDPKEELKHYEKLPSNNLDVVKVTILK